MKVLVPPTECECSFSSGTFSKNNDVTMRKLYYLVTYSTGRKPAKKKVKTPNGDYSNSNRPFTSKVFSS